MALSHDLGAGYEYRRLWMCYCDYLQRRINWSEPHTEKLEELRENLNQANTYLYTSKYNQKLHSIVKKAESFMFFY